MTTVPITPEIRSFLEKHPDFDRAELDLTAEDRAKRLVAVDATKLTAWIASLDDSSRVGVRQAWMVGRVLVAQRAIVPKGKGNVAQWETALASVLKKFPRTLQLYRQLAEGLDDTKIAMALRERDLDDGLNVVIGRIRNVRNGREPDYKPPKADEDRQAELAMAALDKAVKGACKHLGATWVESWSSNKLPGLLAGKVPKEPTQAPPSAIDEPDAPATAVLPPATTIIDAGVPQTVDGVAAEQASEADYDADMAALTDKLFAVETESEPAAAVAGEAPDGEQGTASQTASAARSE